MTNAERADCLPLRFEGLATLGMTVVGWPLLRPQGRSASGWWWWCEARVGALRRGQLARSGGRTEHGPRGGGRALGKGLAGRVDEVEAGGRGGPCWLVAAELRGEGSGEARGGD